MAQPGGSDLLNREFARNQAKADEGRALLDDARTVAGKVDLFKAQVSASSINDILYLPSCHLYLSICH
jgi:hypothetical protein